MKTNSGESLTENSKMRIGIDTRFYSSKPTGIGTYTHELCLGLLKYDSVKLILFLNDDSPLLKDSLFKDTEKILVREKLFSIIEIFTLPPKIAKAKLDIYHSPSFIMPFLKNIKTVITIHDLIHLKLPKNYSFFHRIYYEFFVKKAALQANQIITDSYSSKKDIEEWLKIKNVKVIYIAANNKFSPHLGITDLFSRFNIKKSDFILYVGNNKSHKNIMSLIKAYANIKNRSENFSDLVLTCTITREVQDFIHENLLDENIKFIGNISDDELILLYSYSLFFICPSLYEGFGLPVLEAMSCGCPVTCSNTTSLPEVAGNAALYFEPSDISDIELAMEKMYQDSSLREELSLKGKLQAKNFSWSKATEETLRVYQSLM